MTNLVTFADGALGYCSAFCPSGRPYSRHCAILWDTSMSSQATLRRKIMKLTTLMDVRYFKLTSRYRCEDIFLSPASFLVDIGGGSYHGIENNMSVG